MIAEPRPGGRSGGSGGRDGAEAAGREGFFFGGATLVIDAQGRVRYAIVKDLDSVRRLRAQRAWLRKQSREIQHAAWAERSGAAAALQRKFHLER